jgi:hypothetical protein
MSEDLFIVLGDMDFDRGRAVIRAIVNPLVFWIWAGGFLLIVATIVAILRPGSVTALLRMEAPLRARLTRPAIFAGVALTTLGISVAVSGLPVAVAGLGTLIIILISLYTAGAIHSLSGADRK